MEEDWDLQAVVRGCASTGATSSSSTAGAGATTSSSFPRNLHSNSWFSDFGGYGTEQASGQLLSFPDPFEERYVSEELHELYKPFVPQPKPLSPQTSPISPFSSLSASLTASSKAQTQQPHPQHQQQLPKQSQAGSGSTSQRSKRRKNLLKKVCQVPAEGLSSDIWAWRKYGQKPIKGSPYPRGYYRCSSSKGCLARKQVERNRSDPGMFIVTYTAEHNHPAPTHRNSLAGSTRQKPFPNQTVPASSDESKKPNSTKPSSPATSMEDELGLPQSTTTDSKEESREEREDMMVEDEEEDEFGISDEVLSDDFFVGLEGLVGPASEDYFSDHLPATFALPNWVANNAG